MEKFNQEKNEQRETISKITLDFFRHAKINRVPGIPDIELGLTEKGREDSVAKGKEEKPQVDVSLAWSSPARRAQESVLFSMLAEGEDIRPDMSIGEIEERITQNIGKGEKMRLEEGLYFNIDGPMQAELRNAIKTDTVMKYLIEQSDQRAVELKDLESVTYSRAAGIIAQIIKRYLNIGNNFNRLAENGKFEKYGNRLERYIATHQNMVESFIAKILEKSQNKERRDQYISKIGSGVGELEGMQVEIINNGPNQKIMLSFRQGEESVEVPLERELIDEVIKEKTILEGEVNK